MPTPPVLDEQPLPATDDLGPSLFRTAQIVLPLIGVATAVESLANGHFEAGHILDATATLSAPIAAAWTVEKTMLLTSATQKKARLNRRVAAGLVLAGILTGKVTENIRHMRETGVQMVTQIIVEEGYTRTPQANDIFFPTNAIDTPCP